MAKTISFSLDPNSIQNAVNEMRQYQREFAQKCQRFRELIAERVAWSASRGFSTSIADDTFQMVRGRGGSRRSMPMQPRHSNVDVQVTHGGDMSVILAEGDEAVFIEYGAGKYYNGAPGSSPHEWGPMQGYLIGEYGLHNGRKNVWGYKQGDGWVILTHGTPAAKPMYNGLQEAIRAIDDIAREVFG